MREGLAHTVWLGSGEAGHVGRARTLSSCEAVRAAARSSGRILEKERCGKYACPFGEITLDAE